MTIAPEVIEAAARALHAHYVASGPIFSDFEEAREDWEAEAESAIRAADEARGLRETFVIIGLSGYGDPFEPWPDTLEKAQIVRRNSGGVIKSRLITDWRSHSDD